jgi:hypothetical protein
MTAKEYATRVKAIDFENNMVGLIYMKRSVTIRPNMKLVTHDSLRV